MNNQIQDGDYTDKMELYPIFDKEMDSLISALQCYINASGDEPFMFYGPTEEYVRPARKLLERLSACWDELHEEGRV